MSSKTARSFLRAVSPQSVRCKLSTGWWLFETNCLPPSATRQKVPLACRLHDPNDALVDATISINEDGSATVEIAGKKMRFPWITLLSSDVDARLAQLDEFLHRYPLYHGDAASLRALVARADFSGDDFLAAAMLFESSPETFIERLAAKVRGQEGENRIAPVDVLPDDDRYWNHLLPPVAGSMTLADYIGQEMNAAWRDGLEADSDLCALPLGDHFRSAGTCAADLHYKF